MIPLNFKTCTKFKKNIKISEKNLNKKTRKFQEKFLGFSVPDTKNQYQTNLVIRTLFPTHFQ